MSTSIIEPRPCWDRPRLVASWLAWLAGLLLVFQPNGGFAGMMLISLMGLLRPSSVRIPSEGHLLKAAIGTLITVPLSAVLLGSPSAMASMRTPGGMTLALVLWIADTAGDFRSYLKLMPVR